MKSYRLYVTASTYVYHNNIHIKLLLVRYGIACLKLLVVILQDLHCLHRSYHITQISIYSRAFVSEIQ